MYIDENMEHFKKLAKIGVARSGSHYTKAVALKRPTLKRGRGWPQASTQMYGLVMKKYGAGLDKVSNY